MYVARDFSEVVNRVGAGKEVEVVRNGMPVMQLRPPRGGFTISASRWPELIATAPPVDADFARDMEAARRENGPPSVVWPS